MAPVAKSVIRPNGISSIKGRILIVLLFSPGNGFEVWQLSTFEPNKVAHDVMPDDITSNKKVFFKFILTLCLIYCRLK